MRELSLNRPVHLAGRDAYYEHAVKLLQGELMNYEIGDRLRKCRTITRVLELANEHADFALRGFNSCREEKLFIQFLRLLLDSAKALQVMTKHEYLLVSDREFLREFFGQQFEVIDRSAAEHGQLARNILKETVQLIQMASGSFDRLREKNLGELAKGDGRDRYQRAYESFRQQGAAA